MALMGLTAPLLHFLCFSSDIKDTLTAVFTNSTEEHKRVAIDSVCKCILLIIHLIIKQVNRQQKSCLDKEKNK